MAGFGFRPARQVDPELEPPDATFPGPGGTGWDPTQPSNVGLLRLTKITHDDERETTDGSAEACNLSTLTTFGCRGSRDRPRRRDEAVGN